MDQALFYGVMAFSSSVGGSLRSFRINRDDTLVEVVLEMANETYTIQCKFQFETH